MCIEKCKHGSGRGLHKPTLEIGKGGAFLLYYAGKNDKGEAVWIHENAGDNNVSMNTVSYWNLYCRLNIMKDR